MDAFSISVTDCEFVLGFDLHSAGVKMLAYAHSVAIFCCDVESVRQVVQLTKLFFYEASGVAVNWEKSCAFFYVGWDATPNALKGIQWTRDP